MSQELTPFVYDGQTVRVIEVDGEPWFVARDVATVLGARTSSDISRMADPEDKGSHKVRTLGGEQSMQVLNESGLYTVLIRSNAPMAKPFRRWVTSEVVPQIRKTGTYTVDQTPQLPKSDDERVLEAMQILSARVQEAQAKVLELTPKANAWDEFLSAEGDVSVNEASKALSRNTPWRIGENGLWDLLYASKWIYRDARSRPRAYQTQVNLDRLAERAQTFLDPRTGDPRQATPQVRVRAKGLDALRRILDEQHRRKAIA
ncbi:BRO family protein [Kocuria sp. MNB10]